MQIWKRFLLGLGGVTYAACNSPSPPAHPTWADVSPIMNGECSGCHGANAGVAGGGYRFDFYDMTSDVCGDAALAMPAGTSLAGTSYATIATDVMPQASGARARMPPAPAPALPDWELQTILRWTANPVKGPAPEGNRAPTLEVTQLPAEADSQVAFTAVLGDPDGEDAVGAIRIADSLFLMSHSGAYAVNVDSSSIPAGTIEVSAVLCDGWTNATTDLGPLRIKH